ncbi:MAG: SPASM domain-containing protein [Anaeromyxobacteraceae bacterium]|nr:SPASM domain-containing protein [Anaeromyxobacteraceae bacterium]
MQLSRHAILADVPGREEVLLVQPLSGQAALLPRASADALRALPGGALPASLAPEALREAGFVVDGPAEDAALLDAALATWRDEVARTQTQLLVVPTFGCASRQDAGALFDRVELWARYVELCEAEPLLRRLHAPRFHGLSHLAATGELPPANFDACPATKTEWAFGPDGGVWGCTATVGHPAHRLGSYFPEVTRDEGAIAAWSGRSTLTIPACQGCALGPVCGGGCGAVAWSRAGTPVEPDCRPVRELYGLGVRHHRLGEGA